MKKRVIVGLSGGVDSSVAAWMLLQDGYEVEALFMKNWHDTTGLLQSDCHWEDDLMFAKMVAAKLNIPFHFVDLSSHYRNRVVEYMFSEYERGRTPNPDVLCNREIKFDSFADEAKRLGGDFVATGHYCIKESVKMGGSTIYRLLAGTDKSKDQSYFLCQLNQDQLAYSLFPVGRLTKADVRKTAQKLGLATAERKDSQGICFVGKVHLPSFLQQQLKAREGKVIEVPDNYIRNAWHTGLPEDNVDIDILVNASEPFIFDSGSGKIIGNHNGAHFFTIGQRKGINIGGHKEPLFVIGTDTKENLLFVGEGDSHPGLYRKGLFIRNHDIHWIRKDLEMKAYEVREYEVRIRYRQPLQKAKLFRKENGMFIIFNKLQRGIAPGQFAAWYEGDELTGSGVIDR